MMDRLRFVLLLISAALPLVFAKGLLNPFLTPREIVYRFLLCALLPLAALSLPRRPARPGLFGASVCGLIAAAALSTIFSVDVATSFWGSPERLMGFVDVAAAILYGHLLFTAFREPRRRTIFLAAWSSAWGILALWALAEKVIPGFWAQFNGDGARSVATIGNAIFLAHGLILALPIAVLVLRQTLRGPWRTWAPLGALALAAAAVLATGTRGALLGLLAGGAVAGLLLGRWSKNPAARVAAVALPVAGLLCVAGLFALRDAPWLGSVPLVGRAAGIFQSDASTVQRFQLWGVALEAIRARPLTGWGFENFDVALDRHYDPALTGYGVAQSFSDRAHDGPLDVAAAAGLLGLLAACLFFAALTRRVWVARRTGATDHVSAAALLGGLAAYLVALLTAFDSQMTALGLAVLAAAVASLTSSAPRAPLASRKARIALAVAAVIAALVFATATVALARGALLAHRAVVAAPDADLRPLAWEMATFWNPYRALQEQRVANEIFKRVGNAPAWLPGHADMLRAAEVLMRDAVARRPGNFGARFTLANVVLLGAINGAGSAEEAAALFEEARALAPRRQMVDYQLGNLYLTQNDPAAAVAAFERALALNPSVAESHWHLGRALAVAGETARAAESFRFAWTHGFKSPRPEQEYAVAIQALTAAGDLATVRDIYALRADWAGTNADLFAALAAVEAELGNRDAAVAALRRAVALDPTLRQEAAAFIQAYGLPADALNP